MAPRTISSILGYVAQVTFYVPDDLARRLRRDARRAGKSLSAYLTQLLADDGTGRGWPEGFFDLWGSCRGSLKRPDDPPPEEVEGP